MSSFYLLQAPSERTYQYAYKDTSLIGLQKSICETCGRTLASWEFHAPHCLVVQGGAKYPDRLSFTGAGYSPLVLSENAVKTFVDHGISGISMFTSIQVMKEQHDTLIPLPKDAPRYVLAQIDGKIDLDLEMMCLRKKNLCKICGSFDWNRQRLYPLFLKEETWDGSDICRVDSIPGYIICTEQVVKLIKSQKLKGFCFRSL